VQIKQTKKQTTKTNSKYTHIY